MIKLIISDLDGVLITSKKIHYEAFNKALITIDKSFEISHDEHLKMFDGLSTKNKLVILVNTKKFPIEREKDVNNLKQKFTIDLYNEQVKYNEIIVETVKKLKNEGFLFYVASNAVPETIEIAIKNLGIFDLVDKIYSNKSVEKQKPHSQIYLKCMVDAGVEPSETVIIEDSVFGREAAVKSGAHVLGVDAPSNFTYEHVKSFIKNIPIPNKIGWSANADLNILIPLAGAGSRFATVGYKNPKPLIMVNGKPMIQRVVENLNISAHYIFVCQRTHYDEYNLGTMLNLISPGCTIVQQEGKLDGAAMSALLAEKYIDNEKHLLIANSDQIVDWNSAEFMYNMIANEADGGILTFKASGNKWSYAKIDEHNNVIEVAEKNPISDNGTVGIYYYNRGSEFIKYSNKMISNNIRTNNEFYICPIFNEYIADGKKIKTQPCNGMHGLGTPEDLEAYILHMEA